MLSIYVNNTHTHSHEFSHTLGECPQIFDCLNRNGNYYKKRNIRTYSRPLRTYENYKEMYTCTDLPRWLAHSFARLLVHPLIFSTHNTRFSAQSNRKRQSESRRRRRKIFSSIVCNLLVVLYILAAMVYY